MHALFLLAVACTPPTDAGDTASDTADDTHVETELRTIHAEGTIDGEAFTFDCDAEAEPSSYSSFLVGVNWSASLSCTGSDGESVAGVGGRDAEVDRVYRAEDAASFNGFMVDDGETRFDYSDAITYALVFTTVTYEEGVGVTLAGTFSGTWADAELVGEFAGYAPCEYGCAE